MGSDLARFGRDRDTLHTLKWPRSDRLRHMDAASGSQLEPEVLAQMSSSSGPRVRDKDA